MTSHAFQKDIDAVKSIDAVSTILDVICSTTKMGFSAVARVTEDRWIACTVRDHIGFGLEEGGELEVKTTICDEIRQSKTPVVIDHVAKDAHFCTHHTPAKYGFQSYISMPIVLKDGTFFGTLCAIDPNPHPLNNPETIGMFKLFAELIAFHLQAEERIIASETKLYEERGSSMLREQFIAMLGHDLRNPLGAISSGAALLQRMPLDERGKNIATIIQNSVGRMSHLIENVLDFARGRLGAGIALNHDDDTPVERRLRQVIAEMRLTYPDRSIEEHFAIAGEVYCDQGRVAQVLSNLLGNAIKYGASDQPVRVEAFTENNNFMLSIANGGEAIPADKMAKLFEAFERGETATDQQGLGLGLYISSQIAEAHGGKLTATSDAKETRFTLTIPAAAKAEMVA